MQLTNEYIKKKIVESVQSNGNMQARELKALESKGYEIPAYAWQVISQANIELSKDLLNMFSDLSWNEYNTLLVKCANNQLHK